MSSTFRSDAWGNRMCDTILAPPGSTANHSMLFGKNSDRQANEAQAIEMIPGKAHEQGARVASTYIDVPQVERTNAVLLSRPCWVWGAEMGANEHGVVIGNEGVHARTSASREPALTGMDLVRLGLERAATAAAAVEVITSLLERHGQGGNCGHLTPAYYNNSFMIADASEAYVLETVGREWLVERLRNVRAISNAYTIGRDVERHSQGLPALIRSLGCSEEREPDYAAVISDPHREHIGSAGVRRACSTALLHARAGQLRVSHIMEILRNHGHGDQLQLDWDEQCAVRRTVCMHSGAEDRPGQTVASMVSELRSDAAVHWVTGTAAPCMSVFKPVLMGVPLPDVGPAPTDRFDARTLWWRHEKLHRAALLEDFGHFLRSIRCERDELEALFRQRIIDVLSGGGVADQAHVVAQCWDEAQRMEASWASRIGRMTARKSEPYVTAWQKLNQLAGL